MCTLVPDASVPIRLSVQFNQPNEDIRKDLQSPASLFSFLKRKTTFSIQLAEAAEETGKAPMDPYRFYTAPHLLDKYDNLY